MVLLLGTILDSSSIMLITIPLVLPALIAFNTDLLWFGIVNLLAVEIGMLTPPFKIADTMSPKDGQGNYATATKWSIE